MAIQKKITAPTEQDYEFWVLGGWSVQRVTQFGKQNNGNVELQLHGYKDEAAWKRGAAPGWTIPVTTGQIPFEKFPAFDEASIETAIVENIEHFKGGKVSGASPE